MDMHRMKAEMEEAQSLTNDSVLVNYGADGDDGLPTDGVLINVSPA